MCVHGKLSFLISSWPPRSYPRRIFCRYLSTGGRRSGSFIMTAMNGGYKAYCRERKQRVKCAGTVAPKHVRCKAKQHKTQVKMKELILQGAKHACDTVYFHAEFKDQR